RRPRRWSPRSRLAARPRRSRLPRARSGSAGGTPACWCALTRPPTGSQPESGLADPRRARSRSRPRQRPCGSWTSAMPRCYVSTRPPTGWSPASPSGVAPVGSPPARGRAGSPAGRAATSTPGGARGSPPAANRGGARGMDPGRNRVGATTAVPSGMLWDIDVDGPSVWVGSELGGLFRIDAHTSRVTTIRQPGGAPEGGGGGVGHLVAGAGAGWVASDGQLQRRDARSGRVVATIPWAGGSFAGRGAGGAGGVWFWSGQGLAPFDVPANRLVATVPAASTAGTATLADIIGVAADAGAVWVLTPQGLLRIDPPRVPG